MLRTPLIIVSLPRDFAISFRPTILCHVSHDYNKRKFPPRQYTSKASIAQLGERQTEDLKALCSIHSRGIAPI